MTSDRWEYLMSNDESLTKEEIAEGWHFCHEFDGLLVNYNDKNLEGQFCTENCKPTQ